MSRAWLDDDNVLVVSKPLAKAVGINASIALRRVRHWLKHNEKYHATQKLEHFHDGRWWSKNGYGGWARDIEIMSQPTVRRVFTGLETLRLFVSTSKYNAHQKDQTKWWTIDYDHCDAFLALWEQMGSPIFNDGNRQSKLYQAFLTQWHLRLAFEMVWLPLARTLLTVNRVEVESDPAHGEQGTLLTVDIPTLLTVSSPPAHGEQPQYRESTDESFPEESHIPNKPQGTGGGGDADLDSSEDDFLMTATAKLLRSQGVAVAVARSYGWVDEGEALRLIEQARQKLLRNELRTNKVAYIVGALKKIDERTRDEYARSVAHGFFEGSFEAYVRDMADAEQVAVQSVKAAANGLAHGWPEEDFFEAGVEYGEMPF